jgi:hypothetical protein
MYGKSDVNFLLSIGFPVLITFVFVILLSPP